MLSLSLPSSWKTGKVVSNYGPCKGKQHLGPAGTMRRLAPDDSHSHGTEAL